MIDNKILLDDCFTTFFENLIENYSYILKSNEFNEVADAKIINLVMNNASLNFNSIAKSLDKFYKDTLEKLSQAPKLINDGEKKNIDSTFDTIINDSTDTLDKVIKKTFNSDIVKTDCNEISDTLKKEIRQAAYNKIVNEALSYFDNKKFLKNSKIKSVSASSAEKVFSKMSANKIA